MKFETISESRPFFLVFDRDDEVIDTIRRFAREHQIRGGHFAAIGALANAVVAYWNPQKRDYEQIEIGEQVEVLALTGDVAVEGSETKIHAHIVLGRRDGSTVGGHLVRGVVFPTLEMQLLDYRRTLERRKDPDTDLSLIEIGDEG